jgi:hypothetical protein
MNGEMFATIERALDERTIGHNPERLNLMKGGLVYSNAVTTVSPSYAQEMLTGGAAGWLRATVSRPEIKTKVRGAVGRLAPPAGQQHAISLPCQPGNRGGHVTKLSLSG